MDLANLSDEQLLERLPDGPLKDELDRRLSKGFWFKRVAAYLGEIHAANLHVAELKAVSREQKQRFKSIMEKAAKMLRGELSPNNQMFPLTPEQEIANAIERLEDHAQKVPLK